MRNPFSIGLRAEFKRFNINASEPSIFILCRTLFGRLAWLSAWRVASSPSHTGEELRCPEYPPSGMTSVVAGRAKGRGPRPSPA